MNIKSLGDLLKTSEQELLSYKNFGETSLNEIKALLAQKGLRLGQAVEDGKGAAGGAAAAVRRAPVVAGNVAPDVLNKSVADLELSVRSRKALQRLNINSLGELASRTEDELLGCKNFGQTSLNEIKQQLASFGLGLRKLEDGAVSGMGVPPVLIGGMLGRDAHATLKARTLWEESGTSNGSPRSSSSLSR
jgi:DNA-directed RNA polymerase subunit alpha